MIAARGTLLSLIVALTLTATALSAEQEAGTAAVEETAGASPALAPPAADLVLANRQVFTFRAVHLGVSPEGRAEAALARIRAWLRHGDSGEIEQVETPEGTLIAAGGEGLFRIAPGDVNAEAGETLPALRERTVASLRVALDEERELLSLPTLLKALGWAGAATLMFLIAAWAVRRAVKWARSRLEGFALERFGRLQMGGFTLLTPEQLSSGLGKLVGALRLLANLSLAYIWLTFTLTLFPYTRPWGEELGSYLFSLTGIVMEALLASVPGLVIVVVILIAARYATVLIGSFFSAVERGDVSVGMFHPDTALATRRIAVVLLWLFAAALAYPNLPGSSSAAFQGISIMAGLMLSLGSTTVVGQITSGFVILYARKFRAGDYVRIGDIEGTFLSVGLYTTKLRTNKLEEVSIPIALVLATETKNYSRSGSGLGAILYTSVTIGYDAPWRQVHALLLLAAERTPGLRKEPPPFVYQTALSDFYVDYQLNAHIEKPEERIRTLAALHANIQDAFNEAGVQIMSPHYESDPEAPKLVPKERWRTPPSV